MDAALRDHALQAVGPAVESAGVATEAEDEPSNESRPAEGARADAAAAPVPQAATAPALPSDQTPATRDAAVVPALHDRPRVPFGMRRGDQRVLGLLVCVILVLAAVRWAQLSGWGLRPVEIDRLPARQYEYRLDLNRATWVEWMQLPGIGETLARRIVAHREQHGPFQSVDDLQNVKGIGPKTTAKLRVWLLEPTERSERSLGRRGTR